MTDLTRDELDDLLGAWAVDALDDDDRLAVEAALGRHADLAATARELREGAARLGVADAGPLDGLAEIIAAATAARAPGQDVGLADTGPTTTVEAYTDQVGALSRVLDRVPDDGWDRPVAAYAWSVRDLVAHLVVIEAYSASLLGLGVFDAGDLEDDHIAMADATIVEYRVRPVADVVAEWRQLADRTVAHLAALDPAGLEQPMPLHGIPFRVITGVVARAFELWTHADDIRRAIGEPLDVPPPEVVHRMATESVSSLPVAALGLAEPPGPAVAHIVLTGPGGGTWTLRLGGARRKAEPDVTLITDVIDYCRVVSRRQDIDTLAMTTEGDATLAVKLLQASQFVAM